MTNESNVHQRTVESFGNEWAAFNQAKLAGTDGMEARFNEYFGIFPWASLPDNPVGADVGCGSGRWALQVAPKVGVLHCVDASAEALEVAKEKLFWQKNCVFHRRSVGDMDIRPGSLDFVYSLGVLHHVPDTAAAVQSCARLLKPGAPLLLYLYYAMETRPLWYRAVWRASDLLRRGISSMPYWPKRIVCEALAALVYWPISRVSLLLSDFGINTARLPLSWYRDKPYYTLRTNAFDRFATALEHRFTRAQIEEMMRKAGLENIVFSEGEPFWCAVGTASK